MYKLFIALALTLGIGFIAGYDTADSIGTWYVGLNKPFFNPPNWLFAPVWTILYILMGISLYLVWRLPETGQRNIAIFIFVLQLAFNFVWSFIFFNMHLLLLAFADITILWMLIIFTMYLFSSLSKPAMWLLYPYLLWVSFAAVLNFSVWWLNR